MAGMVPPECTPHAALLCLAFTRPAPVPQTSPPPIEVVPSRTTPHPLLMGSVLNFSHRIDRLSFSEEPLGAHTLDGDFKLTNDSALPALFAL